MIGVRVITRSPNLVTGSLMNNRVEGIVLSQMDYKENAVLLQVFTKEYGKISFVVRGARKIVSKQQGSILPFSKGEFLFDYVDGKTMFTLKQVKTIKMHKKFLQNFDASTGASMVCEVIQSITNQSFDLHEVELLYSMLDESLDMLEEGKHVGLLTSIFLARVLEVLGFGVVVDGCCLCGNTQIASISMKDGGFLCLTCMKQEGARSYDASTLRSFRYVNKAKIQDFNVLQDYVENEQVLLGLMVGFYEFHTGLRLRSYQFYKELC